MIYVDIYIKKINIRSTAWLSLSVGSIEADSCPIFDIEDLDFGFESMHKFNFPIVFETSLNEDLIMSGFDHSDFLPQFVIFISNLFVHTFILDIFIVVSFLREFS